MTMANSDSILGFTGGVLNVGLSSTIFLPQGLNQASVFLEWSSGGPIYISGTSTAAGTSGFPWGVTLVPSLKIEDYRGSLFFTATGATGVINWYKPLTSQS